MIPVEQSKLYTPAELVDLVRQQIAIREETVQSYGEEPPPEALGTDLEVLGRVLVELERVPEVPAP